MLEHVFMYLPKHIENGHAHQKWTYVLVYAFIHLCNHCFWVPILCQMLGAQYRAKSDLVPHLLRLASLWETEWLTTCKIVTDKSDKGEALWECVKGVWLVGFTTTQWNEWNGIYPGEGESIPSTETHMRKCPGTTGGKVCESAFHPSDKVT
jgi:hypothetical protein